MPGNNYRNNTTSKRNGRLPSRNRLPRLDDKWTSLASNYAYRVWIDPNGSLPLWITLNYSNIRAFDNVLLLQFTNISSMNSNRKNLFMASIAASLIGVFLLFTEDFGAWQDRNSFFGVVEGYVWIGSEKVFPWAQIGILAISAALIYTAYASYKGYSGQMSADQLLLGHKAAQIELGLTVFFGLLFVVLVWNSDWWWLDTGFYGALVTGLANLWIYRQLIS